MAIWKITPVAAKGDPRWLDHQIWDHVEVRASTAAEARRIAGEMERRARTEAASVGNESESFESGFLDEKLYAVRRIDLADARTSKSDGPMEVVWAKQAS